MINGAVAKAVTKTRLQSLQNTGQAEPSDENNNEGYSPNRIRQQCVARIENR